MGKLADFYEKQMAEKLDQATAEERDQARREAQAQELALDIDEFAKKRQRFLKSGVVDGTVVTSTDAAGTEVTIEVIDPDPTKPELCYHVTSSAGDRGLKQYDEPGLFEFLIDWIETLPNATTNSRSAQQARPSC